jgi:quercetin dioxygenase-like cupin family protein
MADGKNGATARMVAAGEGTASLLLGQVGRVLVAGTDTGMAYAVMSACGPAGRPIPLHFHEKEHEIFFCTRGRVQLWTNEESRILLPGDFGSVPPGVLHAYQFHEPDSEFMGPLSPGGWERFFQFTGTPYDGPAFPPVDNNPPPFAKFAAAEAEFHQKFRPDVPYAAASEGADDRLPGTQTPYYLRHGAGPRATLYGQVARLLTTGAETGGTMGMAVVTGPKGAGMPEHHHERSTESLFVLRGSLDVRVDGQAYSLIAGDSLNIPAGARHSYMLAAGVTEFAVMVGAGGSERLFAVAGKPWDLPSFPEGRPAAPDAAAIAAVGHSVDTFV